MRGRYLGEADGAEERRGARDEELFETNQSLREGFVLEQVCACACFYVIFPSCYWELSESESGVYPFCGFGHIYTRKRFCSLV